MRRLRIALAQINTTVGDFDGNVKKILGAVDTARTFKADIVTLPELAICGYPPEDLLFKPQFIQANLQSLRKVIEASNGITAVVGFVDSDGDIYNAAALISDGKLIGTYHKMYLPNYGVFDENRYFRAGTECPVYVVNGVGIGINICEDIYNNLIGGQDELVFDGHSCIFDERGNLITRGKQFEEDFIVADLDIESVFRARLHDPRWRKESPVLEKTGWHQTKTIVSLTPSTNPKPLLKPRDVVALDPVAEVYQALVLGTGDYIRKNGFEKVVIGLSGGVDSAIVAAIAVDALGKDNVIGISMPSRYSSTGSVTDTKALVKNLGIKLKTIAIEKPFQAYLDTLTESFTGTKSDSAEENLQARVRGNLLMALSNKFGWLVLTTGNKSEMATGYTTLYGDMAGGFAVIKDVPKTLVYKLVKYRNAQVGYDLIPAPIIDKPPSAELRPDQKDSDSLPPYEVLDSILTAYVEDDKSVDQIVSLGFDKATVQKTAKLVDRSEYKRRQAPPGVKITGRAFGRDRRLPLTNLFKEW